MVLPLVRSKVVNCTSLPEGRHSRESPAGPYTSGHPAKPFGLHRTKTMADAWRLVKTTYTAESDGYLTAEAGEWLWTYSSTNEDGGPQDKFSSYVYVHNDKNVKGWFPEDLLGPVGASLVQESTEDEHTPPECEITEHYDEDAGLQGGEEEDLLLQWYSEP